MSETATHGYRRYRQRPVSAAIFAAVTSAWLAASVGVAMAATPQRIVSLNVCVDQILIDLVPHDRIAAVTHLATDPLTAAKPEAARGLPFTRGAAEDVLARDPDLILAGEYSTPATVGLLRRLGRRVVTVPQPETLDDVRALIRAIAAATEAAAQGEVMIADMDRRIAAVASQVAGASRPTALVYQVNNFVARPGALVDEALGLAGFRNAAADMPTANRAGQVALETLALRPPDLLVLASGPSTYRTALADNLRHPLLVRLAASRRAVVLPWPLWLCGTHHIAEAIERLAAERR